MLEQADAVSAVIEPEVAEAELAQLKDHRRQVEKANSFYQRVYEKWSGAVTSKTVLVQPQDVDELLEGENYRTFSEATVDHYVSEIIAGRWRLGPAIYYSKKGKLLNGQHRLLAVKKSGVAVPFVFVYGLPDNSATAFDNGKNRTASQTVAYEVRQGALNQDLYGDFPGAAGIAKAIEAGNVYKKRNYVSNTALKDMIQRHEAELAFVKEVIFTPLKDDDGGEVREGIKGLRRATFCAVVGRAFRKHKGDKQAVSKLKKAVLRIRAGYFDKGNAQDAMFKLFRDCLTHLTGGGQEVCEEIYVKTAKVLDAVLNGETLKVITKTKNYVDPFEIDQK